MHAVYPELTLDAAADQNPAIDERVRQALLAEDCAWLLLTWVTLMADDQTIRIILSLSNFDYTAVAGNGKVEPVNQVNHTSWVALVSPTDRPKSVRKRCVIELFVALFVLSLCLYDIAVGRGFCHRTKSDLFLFLFERRLTIWQRPMK